LRLIPAFHPQHRFEALFHHGDTESRRKADHPESQNSFFLVAVLPAADPLREKREKLGTRFVDARTTACEYSLGPWGDRATPSGADTCTSYSCVM